MTAAHSEGTLGLQVKIPVSLGREACFVTLKMQSVKVLRVVFLGQHGSDPSLLRHVLLVEHQCIGLPVTQQWPTVPGVSE